MKKYECIVKIISRMRKMVNIVKLFLNLEESLIFEKNILIEIYFLRI